MKKLLVAAAIVATALGMGSQNVQAQINQDSQKETTAVVSQSLENQTTEDQYDDGGYWKYQKSLNETSNGDISQMNVGAYGDGYIHNSRYDNYTKTIGIDVAKYQGEIDWTAVKDSGVEYAIIRVGNRGWGSGSVVVDPTGITNLQNAKAAGLKVGAYIYSQAITVDEGVEEADFAMGQISASGVTLDLPVVIDYEYASEWDASTNQYITTGRLYEANLSKEQATDVVNAFCNRVKSNGYDAMVYANKSMLEDQLYADQISGKVWLAHYINETPYAGSYDYWQYTDKGSVPGINTTVDMDFWYVENKPTGYTGWKIVDGKKYWYDNDVMATSKEAYDPSSDGWYWFDADGIMATNKDVFIPTNADRTAGKWVRYDENGKMRKGEDYRYGGWYWFDPITGEMIKGFVNIPDGTPEGKWVYYDPINGQMHHGESCINGNWYYFDDCTGKMAHGEVNRNGWYYYDEITGIMAHGELNRNGNWYYYDQITGIMAHGWVTLPDGRDMHYDEITGILM